MRILAKAAGLLGLLIFIATLHAPAAQATNYSVKFLNNSAPLTHVTISVFASNDRINTLTDANGIAHFTLPSNAGVWIEVAGERLAQFYRAGQLPGTIDVALVGHRTWNGRN